MAYVEQKDVLDRTDHGLDVIKDLYPDVYESVNKPNRKFKTRDEKTASAKLNRAEDGSYLVIDFGGDQKSRNAIECYALENKCDYVTALRELAQKHNVTPTGKPQEVNRAAFGDRPAEPDENEGTWTYKIKEDLSDFEIETIISKNILYKEQWHKEDKKAEARESIKTTFKYLRCHPLTSYSIVKDRKVLTFSATDTFPIFLIDEGSHKKIYQPLHQDKSKRFMYIPGHKPKDFIHGLAQLTKAYQVHKQEVEEKEQYDDDDSKKKKKQSIYKLDEVILCTGFSDAINVCLAGYNVIWLNSESAKLLQKQYDEIMIMVDKFYVLNDLDATGKRAAHELCMTYLDIYNIELPAALMKYRDRRGNPSKDVRDYFNHYWVRDFRLLVEFDSMPYRFWDKTAKFNKAGEYTGSDYEFRNEYAYNFLQKNGFFRLPVGDKDHDFEYIQIDGNVVRKTSAVKVKAFVKNFLRSRQMDMKLRDAMHKTTQLNESSLTALDELDLSFVDNDKETQFLFFQNKTLEITANGIIEHKPGTVEKYVWEDEVYQHRFEAFKTVPFEITKDELGSYDIKINDDSCMFLRLLIQTSRMHWRTELEERVNDLVPAERDEYIKNNQFNIAGPLLSAEEIEEQKRHLVNKIFSIGYLMHRYKDRSKPWFIFAMDGKLSEDGQSWGGSGKSVIYDTAMRALMSKSFMLPGRNPKLTDDAHKYDGLTEHHRYILVDDAHKYLKLDVFYTEMSNGIKVNPKNKSPFEISFENSGKFAFTSNYTPVMQPSTERRMIITVCSDYYHNAGETTDYKSSWDPKMEFGKQMFKEFDATEWNAFYNTAIAALQFYLTTTEKIGPGMDNVNKRNLHTIMGDDFKTWALAFFSEMGDKLDRMITRELAFNDFKHTVGGKWTPQSFMDRLKAFCKLSGYTLNPKQFRDKNDKIIRKVDAKVYDPKTNIWTDIGGAKNAKEMIYIQTLDEAREEGMQGIPVRVNIQDEVPEQLKLNTDQSDEGWPIK